MEQLTQQPIQEKTEVKPPTRNRLRENVFLFLVVTIVFLIAFIPFWIYLSLNLKGKQQAPISTAPTTLSPSPTTDKIANWRTYRNKEFGFEFRYPRDWEFMEAKTREDYSNIVWLFPRGNTGESVGPEISIAVVYRPLDEEKVKRERGGIRYNYSKISVAGRDGYASALLQGVHGEVKEVLMDARNEQTFIIFTQNAINTFDQILSTFRFVD